MNYPFPSIILPDQAFFIPNPDFLQFLKSETSGKTLVDCGCGNGHLTSKLRELGCNVIPIDLCYRENCYNHIIHNATTFQFPENSVAIIARPNRGNWIYDTMVRALESASYVVYIGLKSHLDEDIFSLNSLDFCCEKIYDGAGKDKEVVYKISIPQKENINYPMTKDH